MHILQVLGGLQNTHLHILQVLGGLKDTHPHLLQGRGELKTPTLMCCKVGGMETPTCISCKFVGIGKTPPTDLAGIGIETSYLYDNSLLPKVTE